MACLHMFVADTVISSRDGVPSIDGRMMRSLISTVKTEFSWLTAKLGDIVVADTTGCHRGTKVVSDNRSMLRVNYVVHPEFAGSSPPQRIALGGMTSMSDLQVRALDFLDVRTGNERW